MELVGVKFSTFTGDDGQRISGARLFCLGNEVASGSGMGREVESFFLSSQKLPKVPPVGSVIEPVYNKYGKVTSVNVVD